MDSWYVSMFQFAYNTGKPVYVDSNTGEAAGSYASEL